MYRGGLSWATTPSSSTVVPGRGLSRGVVRFVDSIIYDGDIIDLSALVLVH